jgi:hypothetical protein
MTPFFRVPLALAILTASSAFAQGGSAIISLEIPPAGDGHGALQTGAAIPSGVASAWYNPALLPGLKSATGSAVHTVVSREDIFIPGAGLDFVGVAAIMPLLGTDVGIALYRSALDFGGYPPTDSSDTETVHGLAAGFAVMKALDVGMAVKRYHSEIGTAESNGWAFDVGVASITRLRPFADLASLEIAPSLGMVVQNLGPDAWYVDPEQSDPLPTTWRSAAGIELDFADFLRIAVSHDWEKAVHRRASWSDSWQRTYGISASLLGLRYGTGWLKDPDGGRDERHEALEYELNFKRLRRVVHRVSAGDFVSSGETLNVGSTLGGRQGVLRDVNPRLVVGIREIIAGGRTGQDTWYFALSL